jgi:hypothetical protein
MTCQEARKRTEQSEQPIAFIFMSHHQFLKIQQEFCAATIPRNIQYPGFSANMVRTITVISHSWLKMLSPGGEIKHVIS